MLAALAEGGWIDAAARDDLTRAYLFLREIEHCLQMVGDEQTHTLPEDDAGLAVIARMAGFVDTVAFAKALTATLTTVRDRYAHLFEAAPTLTSAAGSLVFTGEEDDPGDAIDAAPSGLPQTGGGDACRPRLAPRPLSRDAFGQRPRAAH